MNYSTIGLTGQSTIEQMLRGIQFRMGELGNSPALPELVRPAFGQLSMELDCALNMSRDMAERDMLNGQGPNSRALMATKRFLKLDSVTNLDHLAVVTNFSLGTTTDVDLAHRIWTQFFRQEYTTEFFKRDGTKLVYVHPFGSLNHADLKWLGGTVTVELDATVGEEGPYPEKALIKHIQFQFGPIEGFWTAFATVTPRDVLFDKEVRLTAHVMHNVEQANCTVDLHGAADFLQWFMVDNLRRALGFKFEDYGPAVMKGYNYSLVDELFNLVDQEPKWARTHLLDRIVRACSTQGRQNGLSVDVPDIGVFTVGLGRSEWDTYTKFMEESKKYTWGRDYQMIKPEGLKVSGVEVLNRSLPTSWGYKILIAVTAVWKEMIETAKSEKYYKRMDPDYVKPEEE